LKSPFFIIIPWLS